VKPRRVKAPKERVIFSMLKDGTIVPGPDVKPVELATTVFRATSEAAAGAVRIRAARAAAKRSASATDLDDLARRVAGLLRQGRQRKNVPGDVNASMRQVERAIARAKKLGLVLSPG